MATRFEHVFAAQGGRRHHLQDPEAADWLHRSQHGPCPGSGPACWWKPCPSTGPGPVLLPNLRTLTTATFCAAERGRWPLWGPSVDSGGCCRSTRAVAEHATGKEDRAVPVTQDTPVAASLFRGSEENSIEPSLYFKPKHCVPPLPTHTRPAPLRPTPRSVPPRAKQSCSQQWQEKLLWPHVAPLCAHKTHGFAPTRSSPLNTRGVRHGGWWNRR